MNYQTQTKNGVTFIVGHLFEWNEIEVGSKWTGGVTVDRISSYPASDHEDEHHYYVHYSWDENGERKNHKKDLFSFQVRHSLIVE